MQQKQKNFSKRVVGNLHSRNRMAARLTSREWPLISKLLTPLFVLASLISISHATRLIQLNSFFLLLWNNSLLNGSYILALQVILSVNGPSRLKHSIFTPKIRNPVVTGSICFLSATPTLSYPRHVVLTQNVPKHSTALSLIATLMSLLVLSSPWVFRSKTYITWTRRVVREVAGRRAAAESTSTHESSVQSISIAVTPLRLISVSRIFVSSLLTICVPPAHLQPLPDISWT